MRINKAVLICGAIVMLSTVPVVADIFTPSHSCFKPSKPYQFDSQWEVDNFNEDVQRFKRCISDFVEEQNEAALMHQEAAEDAIDDWNDFVRYELN